MTFTKDLKGALWIDPNHSGGGIPLVGFFYFTHLPCAVRVEIGDRNRKYREINIEKITVEYESGDKYVVKTPWIRKLEPYTAVNSSSQGLIYTPMFKVCDTTPRVIKHHSDCAVTLAGVLTTVSGEQIPFAVTKSFEHKFKFCVTSFWRMMASI